MDASDAEGRPGSEAARLDHSLVRRALSQRDHESLRQLAERLACLPAWARGFASRQRLALGAEELEDAVQTAIVGVWSKLDTYRGDAALSTWAWRFVVFELQNRVRKQRRQQARRVDVEDLDSLAGRSPEPVPDLEPRALTEALDGLPGEMREVVDLRHDEGLMFHEIGARLGVAENTVKTRYYRALERLRVRLGSTFGGERP